MQSLLSSLDAMPFAYMACCKLAGLCVLLGACVALTNYQRWRR